MLHEKGRQGKAAGKTAQQMQGWEARAGKALTSEGSPFGEGTSHLQAEERDRGNR